MRHRRPLRANPQSIVGVPFGDSVQQAYRYADNSIDLHGAPTPARSSVKWDGIGLGVTFDESWSFEVTSAWSSGYAITRDGQPIWFQPYLWWPGDTVTCVV